jgi:hypothetical protein
MTGRKWPETARNGGRLHWKPRFQWTVVLEKEEEEKKKKKEEEEEELY